MSDFEDVKVVPGDAAPVDIDAYRTQRRTEAQRAQDDILDKAAEHAEAALEHVNKALDWLSVVTQPKNRNVPIYVNQLVEEIESVRRFRQ